MASVHTRPGVMELQRMPKGPPSAASWLTNALSVCQLPFVAGAFPVGKLDISWNVAK